MTAESEWKKLLNNFVEVSAWGGDIKKALCALDAFIHLMDFDFSPHCISGRLRHRAESSETLSIIHRLFRSRLFNHTPARRMLLGRKKLLTFFIPFMLHVEFLFSSIPCRRAGIRNIHNVNILLIEMMN